MYVCIYIYRERFSITMIVFRGVEHDGFFLPKVVSNPAWKKPEFANWLQYQASVTDETTWLHPCKMSGWFTSNSLQIEIRKIIWTKNLHDIWLQIVWIFPSDSPPVSLTIFALASCQHSCFKKYYYIYFTHIPFNKQDVLRMVSGI